MSDVTAVAVLNEFCDTQLIHDPAVSTRTVDVWDRWRLFAAARGVATGSRPDAVRSITGRAGLSRTDGVVHGARLVGDL